LWADLTGYGLPIGNRRHSRQGCLRYDGGGDVVYVYKRWKIGNIGYIVGLQELKWQQIGNTIGNNRQQSSRSSACHRNSACHRGNHKERSMVGFGLSEAGSSAVPDGLYFGRINFYFCFLWGELGWFGEEIELKD